MAAVATASPPAAISDTIETTCVHQIGPCAIAEPSHSTTRYSGLVNPSTGASPHENVGPQPAWRFLT